MADYFGKHNPRKVSPHFFFGATDIDYTTAIRADVSMQDFTVCPRHWYIDATFKCARCGNEFVFTADEQRFWYEDLRFYVDTQAKHCIHCRRDLREIKALRQEYDRDIAEAMKHDSELALKKRLLLIVETLEDVAGKLPDRIEHNRRVLTTQVQRLDG